MIDGLLNLPLGLGVHRRRGARRAPESADRARSPAQSTAAGVRRARERLPALADNRVISVRFANDESDARVGGLGGGDDLLPARVSRFAIGDVARDPRVFEEKRILRHDADLRAQLALGGCFEY